MNNIQVYNTYFIEANVCLIVFYGIYHLFLKNTTFFQYNRIYLLVSLVLCLLLPAMNIPITTEILRFDQLTQIEQSPEVENTNALLNIDNTKEQAQKSKPVSSDTAMNNGTSLTLFEILFFIYLLGLIFLLSRLGINIFKVLHLIHTSSTKHKEGYTLVSIDSDILAYSFFKHLFWNGNDDHNSELILEHEKVHIHQYHSIDILLVEIITALFWFNPIPYVIKKQLNTIHEYIADRKVINKNIDRDSYSQLLISLIDSTITNRIVTPLNSQIKDRITMMYQKKSSPRSKLKFLIALPVIIALMAMFSFTEKPVPSSLKTPPIPISKVNNGNQHEDQYVLQLGSIQFNLSKQVIEQKNHKPPTHTLTYKTMDKLVSHTPRLINMSTNEEVKFSAKWEINNTLSSYSKGTNILSEALKSFDRTKRNEIYIYDINCDEINSKLNLDISICSVESNFIRWGTHKILIGSKIKMTADEFKYLSNWEHTPRENCHVYSKITWFDYIEKTSKDGAKTKLDIHEFPLFKNKDDTGGVLDIISQTKPGDKYTIKKIRLESPRVENNYEITIEIIDNPSGINKQSFTKTSRRPLVDYIIDGKSSTVDEFEELSSEEIISLRMLDKYGEPTLDENKDRIIAILTKKYKK